MHNREKVNLMGRRNGEKRFSTEVRNRDGGHNRVSIYFRFDLNTLIFFAHWRHRLFACCFAAATAGTFVVLVCYNIA